MPMDYSDDIIQIRERQIDLVTQFSLNYRPYLMDFLEKVKEKYEIIIYTYLNSTYTKSILDVIEKKKKYFAYRLSEEYCVFANLYYGEKFLDFLLETRNPSDIILIDKTINCLPAFPDNIIPIPIYNGNKGEDCELAKLSAALYYLADSIDIRDGIINARGIIEES